MSDDPTTDSKKASADLQTNSAADDAAVRAADDAKLVDRTQQLIDEVNQLLGGGGTTPGKTDTGEAGSLSEPKTESVIKSNAESNAQESESAETLRSFLDNLGTDEAEANEDAKADEPAIVEEVDTTRTEPKAGFNLDSLKSVFDNQAHEEPAKVEATIEIPDEPVQSEAAQTPEELPYPDQSEDSAEEPNDLTREETATAENSAKVDFTEKYLNELRSAFNEPDPATVNPDTIKEETAGTAATEDEEEISVEAWLAKNVREVEPEPEPAEEEDAAETTDAANVETANVEAEEKSQEAGQSAATEIEHEDDLPVELSSVAVSPVDEEDDAHRANQPPEAVAANADSSDSISSAVANRMSVVEKRLNEMFSSLSAEIIQLVRGEFDAAPQAALAKSQESANGAIGVVMESANEDKKLDVLKEQLTSKLREAEIELSINRAKLSQQKAQIEQMQADLERREAAVEAKLQQVKKLDGKSNKKGLLDRWKRHMGE